MSKQNEFIQDCIQKFVNKDFPTGFIYTSSMHIKETLPDKECYMLKDVIVWDPQVIRPNLQLKCLACTKDFQWLHPVRWKDGHKSYEGPRSLYGVYNNVMLVS